MSYEKLLALGAQPVAGRMFHVHTEVGQFHAGELVVNAEGEAMLAAAARAEAAAAEATTERKPKTPKAPKPAVDADLDGLDDLLNGTK